MRSLKEIFSQVDSENRLLTLHFFQLGAFSLLKKSEEINAAQEIIDRLYESPYIYSEKKANIDTSEIFISKIEDKIILFGKEFQRLDVKIPVSNQRYHNVFGIPSNLDSFDTFLSGSIFLSYVKVNTSNILHIGHEFKKIVETALNDNKCIEYKSVGPSPMHPVIYVAIMNHEGDDEEWKIHDLKNNDVLIEVVNGRKERIENYIRKIFLEIILPIFEFYMILLSRSACINLENVVHEKFKQFISLYEKDNESSLLKKLTKGYNYRRQITQLSCAFHASLARYEIQKITHLDRADLLLERWEDNHILKNMGRYVRSHVKHRDNIPSSFVESVTSLSASYNSISSAKIASIASFIGAIIGALIATILPLYLKHRQHTTDKHILNRTKIENSIIKEKSDIPMNSTPKSGVTGE